MGFNDYFKDKEMNDDGNAELESFRNDLIQNVAIFMSKVGITDTPILKFFTDDQGLFEAIFYSTMSDPGVKQIKASMPSQMYVTIIGMRFFGAAAYIAACQSRFKKPVDEFTEAEIKQIGSELSQTDAYELALKTLGIDVESNNKLVLDNIIVTAQATAESLAGDITDQEDYLKAYAKVLYNAGVTLVCR